MRIRLCMENGYRVNLTPSAMAPLFIEPWSPWENDYVESFNLETAVGRGRAVKALQVQTFVIQLPFLALIEQ